MLHLLKQPRGFSVFFLSEMWERYGFYITQTLLIFYLLDRFHLSDSASYSILGSFTALAYINPALGGYIADRFLGAKRAILWGAILISTGYIILTFSNVLSHIFFSLSVISIGTGLFKPNISSLLGVLYSQKDPRRHTGYTIFYMGISLGIILGTTLGGYLQQIFGWKVTYLIAALVLIIAWGVFLWGSNFYQLADLGNKEPAFKKYLQSLFFIGATIFLNTKNISHEILATIAFSLVAVLSVFIILYEIYRSKNTNEKRNLFAYLLLAMLSVFFWAIYFQLFFSMNLFIDRIVDKSIFGILVPTSFFIGIQSLGLILFGPLLGVLWHALAIKEKSVSIPEKFSGGLCMMTVALGLLLLSFLFKNSEGLIFSFGVIVAYLIVSIGELMISPIGLSMVTELAPRRLAGVMMGIFFVPLGLGGKLASVFADYAAVSKNVVDVYQMSQIYQKAFGLYFCVCLLMTVISLLLIRVIKKLIV